MGGSSPKPIYAVVAMCQSGNNSLPWAAKLEFYEERVLIYRFRVESSVDSEYEFLRAASYSDIQRCRFIEPHVSQASSTAGMVWAETPGGAIVSIRKADKAGVEDFGFELMGSSHKGYWEAYSALREKILGGGGKA